MDINTIAKELQTVIYSYVQHKDFTKQGNLLFKDKQRRLIDFGSSQNRNIIDACLLLLENDSNEQVRFFTTMILKDKLKYNFYELNDDQKIGQTHTKIVALIRHIVTPSKPVLGNLALCLVYIYIHCIDKIGTIKQFFATTFPSDAQSSRFLYFFKYLEMLPEEIHNQRVVIDEEARTHVLSLLKAQQKQILMEMHEVYSNFNTNKMTIIQKAVLIDAFSNWLQLTEPEQSLVASLPSHSIMNLAISSFNNDLLSAPSMRCLMSAVSIMRNPDKNEQLFQFLGKNLFSLMSEVDTQIRQQLHEPAQNLINVLCEYGSYTAGKFVQSYNQEIEMFILKMLHFTEIQDLDVFKGLIDFWQCFTYEMAHRSSDSTMSEQVGFQIIAKIYMVFCSRIQFSVDDIECLNELSQSQLQKLHKSVEDTLDRREQARYIFESIAKYLGKKPFVKQVISAISSLDRQNKKYWAILQSYIFSLRDVAQKYPQPSDQICQIVMLYEAFPEMPIALKRTFLRVFDNLFTITQKNQEFILKILTYVSSSFQSTLLESKAERAFIRCCQNNAAILINHLSALFGLFEMYPNRETIINGIIIVLRNYPDILRQKLPDLLQVPLAKLTNATNRHAKQSAFNDLITLISSIPSGTNSGNQSLLETLLQQMWPYIQQILTNPLQKKDQADFLVEKSMKFLKLVMRKIPNQFIKYLKDIFSVILEMYRQYPVSSYLYFFQATFATYYQNNEPQMYEFIKSLYSEYCKITAIHISNNPNIISENQRLVDDFIGLSKRMITFHLRMFLESGQFESTLQFSMTCLGSNVPRAASTASQMFQIIFMIYWSPYSRKKWQQADLGQSFKWKAEDIEIYNQLKEFLIPMVPNLIIQMFTYLHNGKADSATNNIVDCLIAIGLAFPDRSQQIWINPLQSIGEDILTRTQKQKLLHSLGMMGSNNHEEFLNAQKQTNKLISLISRRFRNKSSRSKLQKS